MTFNVLFKLQNERKLLDFYCVKDIIGKRIRKIRQGKDLSQENVAAELGITSSAYSKIERGETEVSASKLISIAEILNVEIAEFFVDITRKTDSLQDPPQLYGFATKGDIEELVKMIQIIKKDVADLKAGFNKLNEKPVRQKK